MPGGEVYVVDDDRSMREALQRALQRAGYAVRAFVCPLELIAAIDITQPCVLVLDVEMPAMSGLDLQQALASRGAAIPIILISGQSQPQQIIQGMKGGALDFLLKPFELSDLIRSIEEALTKTRATTVARVERQQLDGKYASLTPREQEVFEAIGEGEMLKNIAIRLGVSNSVMKFHKANLMQKLGCKTLSDLVSIRVWMKQAPGSSSGLR